MAATKVRDIMSKKVISLAPNASVQEAAEKMKDQDVGAVVVVDGSKVRGIVTDRDIVVRAVAEGRDPSETGLSEVWSADMTTVSPDDDLNRAVKLMRDKALRRLPVVDSGKPVGIVSLGDLAMERDEASVLAQVSAASPNK
jgi:CBS domain-containing protein